MPKINRRDSTTWPIGEDISREVRLRAWQKAVAAGETEHGFEGWTLLMWRPGAPAYEVWLNEPTYEEVVAASWYDPDHRGERGHDGETFEQETRNVGGPNL